MTIHKHDLRRAAGFLTDAGFTTADPTPLAAWARQPSPSIGAVISEDGALVAETCHDHHGTLVITPADRRRYHLTPTGQIGLALNELSAATGRRVIHVRRTDIAVTSDDLFEDAAPFREHLLWVCRETQLHWRLVAAHARVAPSVVARVLRDPHRRIHTQVAAAIAALDPEELLEAEQRLVSSTEPKQHLKSLRRLGWTDEQLRPWLTSLDVRLGDSVAVHCTRAAAARILACYDLLTSPAAAGYRESTGWTQEGTERQGCAATA